LTFISRQIRLTRNPVARQWRLAIIFASSAVFL
jgi:hypothetical protein